MKIEKINDIEFFNRESETTRITNILKFKPRLITFIYGPINSGKTSLIENFIEKPNEDHIIFYINLRGKFISDYRDFIKVLFTIEEKGILNKIKNIFKKNLKSLGAAGEKTFYKAKGIPVDASLLETFFKEKAHEDVFNYLEEYFKTLTKHKTPILIIDELQVIGDLKINDYLIYKLFNFFIRLTKELHLCHVFALSSDSLFIEKVYSEAMLQERCNYLLIDEFDKKTTYKFLEKYNFTNEEKELTWQYFRGKPTHLATAILAKIGGERIEETVLTTVRIRKGEIRTALNRVEQLSAEVSIEDKIYQVDYSALIDTLNKFLEKDLINASEIDEITKTHLVKKNILFVDPVLDIIKPQSKIDLIAIREVLKEIKVE